jgi:hypothetical protein
VASSLTSLGANEIDANLEGLFHVLGVANHVHDNDAGFVELVDGPLGRNTHGGDKKSSFLLNDYFDEFRELTIGVICLLQGKINMSYLEKMSATDRTLVLRALPPT